MLNKMDYPGSHIAVEIHPSTRPGTSQLTSATVRTTNLGPVVIHDCRILRNKSGVAWVALPSFSVQQSTTSRQYEYRATVELAPELFEAISLEALRAYRAWSESPNRTEPQGASLSHVKPSR
jgi:hypothetical protein